MNDLVKYKHFPYLKNDKKKSDEAKEIKEIYLDTKEESFLLIGKYGVYELNLLSYDEESKDPFD